MVLHLTLAAAPGLPASAAAWIAANADAVAGLEPGHGAGPLAAWLGDRLGGVAFTVAGQNLASLTAGVAPLVDGAVVVCAPEDASLPQGRGTSLPPLALAVTAGPDAGQLLELTRGNFTIGRHGCALTIADPALSRLHARLEVTDRQVLLRDAGSANGLVCGGKRCRQVVLTAGRTVQMGASQLQLVVGSEPGELFQPEADLTAPVPVAEKPPEPRARMALLLAGLPLLAGLALALLTGMWFFLAFSAMSLLAAAVPYAAGRRQRRRYRMAVQFAAREDARRRRLAAPDNAQLAVALLRSGARSRKSAAGTRVPAPAERLWLRLGTADLPAHIGSAAAPLAEPPMLDNVPLCVDLFAEHQLRFDGAAPSLNGMLRSALLQLGARAAGSALKVVCYALPEPLGSSVRFLPGIDLVDQPGQLAQRLSGAGDSTIVLLVAGDGDAASRLLAGSPGPAAVLWFCGPARPDRQIRLSGKDSHISGNGRDVTFSVDLASDTTLDRFARLAAASQNCQRPAYDGIVPSTCRLQPLLLPADLSERWVRGDNEAGLKVLLGTGAAGPLALDLVVHGPHLLIAGTTGSGKSELLRSLVLSLALGKSPAAVNFLLIDFKGGSGLGVLAGLPHCSGLLTDLTLESVSRSLAWLQAEVRRREALLAAFGVSDVLDCPSGELPRLVVVVDEFRMLGEDAPQALPDLMRVATIGRALGIHLVLATQRPQGAVSSDIRANVTTMIALRTQNIGESRDLLDSPVAADIPVTARGRAYLRIGTGEPILFQAASSTLPAPAPVPVFRSVSEWLQDSGSPAAEDATRTAETGLLVADAADRCRKLGLQWARQMPPPLPAHLTVADLRAARRAAAHPLATGQTPADAPSVASDGPDALDGSSVGIGLLDLPTEQRQDELRWQPEKDGHLAVLGVEGSGHREFLRTLAAQLLASPAERHCYLLDGDGSLGFAAGSDRVGACVGPQETERAARVLRRLAAEVSSRLGRIDSATDPAGTAADVPLIVLVSGWGRWLSSFRTGRFGWAEDCLQDIARDGQATHVTLAVTGERELASSRFLPLMANRLLLPTDAGPETLMSWPRLPPMDNVPGRALVQGRIAGGVCQVVTDPDGAPPPAGVQARPFRVEALPQNVAASMLPQVYRGHPVIGVEGDELTPSSLPLVNGEVYVVLGSDGSGKTNLLALLHQVLAGFRPCSTPPAGPNPDQFWTAHPKVEPGTVLLVDDAAGLGSRAQDAISALVASGAAAVVAARPGPSLLQQVPLALQARASGRGLVLSPRSGADADFFGVRLDDGWRPPGRAFRIDSGQAVPLQVALATGPGERIR